MTSSLEGIKSIDLEEWLTLATAPAPTKLKQGQSPDMQNVWTDEKPGSVITAPGFAKVGQIPSNNPVTFCINYFKTSAGTQTFVVSDNSTVWTTVDFQTFTSIITGLSSSFQLRGAVIRDKLWLTNGSDAVRTFDGTTVTVLDGTAGTPTVPRGRFIAYHDERVWLFHISSARSAVYFSSLTDASANIIAPDNSGAWDTADNFLQISEGDADFGTGMILYRGYLFFFKQYSIWRLVGYDEYTYSRVKTRASTGTRFNESVQILDSVIHLIGIDGIYVFDGEESVRISDIIDPATASQTAFGFNQLQQPNLNNQFWEVSDTADWNAGTVPTNISIDNALDLVAADDSQADFQAGVTKTNVDLTTNPGFLQLLRADSGFSFLITSGLTGVLPGFLTTNNPFSTIGLASYQVDQNDTNPCGYSIVGLGGIETVIFEVDFSSQLLISQIALKNLQLSGSQSVISGNTLIDVDTTGAGNWVNVASGGSGTVSSPYGPTTQTISFTAVHCYKVRARVPFGPNGTGALTITEFAVYNAAYLPTGKFVSKTLDLGLVTFRLSPFNASETLNGETTSYFTQSSDDGITWDAEVATSNGGSIASVPRRYLRWGVNMASDGVNTPSIDAVFLSSVYISAIHNTGGNIFAWGPFESDFSPAGKFVEFYYRGATTFGGVSAAVWNAIVPGGVLNLPISFQYVQFQVEIAGGDATHLPSVSSVTINWIVGTAGQAQTLQNVASAYWRNRYWLSAAGPSATANNTILVRGKKTFNSPWMLKDWNILSFARYFDSLYGGSSLDGSIYQLDTGYSKAGVAVDSYFETGDFTFGGFTCQLVELLVEAERTGPWNLTIGVSVDGGNTFDNYSMDLTPSTYDGEYIKRIHVGYTTTRFRLRFSTNGIDMPFEVHRCIAFYQLDGVRGSLRGDYI